MISEKGGGKEEIRHRVDEEKNDRNCLCQHIGLGSDETWPLRKAEQNTLERI